MKRIGLLLILLALCVPSIQARFLGVKKSSETVAFFIRPPLDSLYGIQRKPDSVHIFTYLDNASAAAYQATSTTYPFSDISIDTLKHFSDTMYVFADAIADIDGAGCNCVLTINVQMYYDKTPTHTFAEVQIITDSLTTALDDATLALAEVVNIDAWAPILDNDSLIIDQSSLEDMTVATVTDVTNDVGVAPVDRGRIGDSAAQRVWNHLDSAWAANTMGSIVSDSTPVDLNAIRDSLQHLVSVTDVNVASVDAGAIESGDIAAGGIGATEIATNAIGAAEMAAGAITISEMPALAYFDTLIYDGALGRGIWVDINAGNTSTAIGTDGTEKNPVSTLAAAKTIADNLGVKRYYISGGSSFTGANDLTVTHEDWEFIGIGTGNAIELDIAGIDVDGSFFFHITLSGVQGGTGDVTVAYCIIGDYTGADGFIHNSGLSDTIRIASTDDLYLDQCFSMVAGNGTPGIGFGAGNSNLSMRHYSGGIEIHDMDGNDKASIETDGQVIVNADCTAPNITVRGNMTLTDNDGGTVWTRDAVFSRQEADLWVWANTDTLAVDSSLMGEWLSTGINASISDANISAIADSSAKQVWGQLADSAFAAGSMGDSAKGWGATAASAGVSDAEMSAIMDSLSNRGFVHYDSSGATLTLAGLRVLASYKDTAIVVRSGDSSAVAAYFKGGDKAPSGEAYAVEIEAGDSTGGVRFKGGATADAATPREGLGWAVESGTPATDNKIAAWFYGGSDGIIIQGESGTPGSDGAVLISGASNAIVLQNNSSEPMIHYSPLSGSPRHSDIVLDSANLSNALMDSIGRHGFGLDFTLASNTAGSMGDSLGTQAYIQGSAGSLDSTAVYGAVEQLLADSMGVLADSINTVLTSAHGAGSWTTGGSGSGANTVVVWTIDSTTNDTLSGIFVAVYNTSNSLVGTARSGATGAAGFSLDDGTYYFIGTALGYTFPPDTTAISGNPDTTAIEGDQYEATAASGDSVCTVTVNVVSSRGTAQSGVWITANLSKSFVVRWDGAVVYNREQKVRSNSSGQVTFYCLYSSAMDPNTDWTFVTEGIGRLKRTVTIPSATTTTIDFGY